MDVTKEIQALTTFRNNPAAFLQQIKKTKRPITLTANGKAVAVLQDIGAYQRLLDIAAKADASEGIRQGLEDIKRGRSRSARRVFDEIRARYHIPRQRPKS